MPSMDSWLLVPMKMHRRVFLVLCRTLDFHVHGGLLGSGSHRKPHTYPLAWGFSPSALLMFQARSSLPQGKVPTPTIPALSCENQKMSPDIAKCPPGGRIPLVENYSPSLTLGQKIYD